MGVMNAFAGILCIIVLLFLFYRESQRKDRRRIGWRIAATVAAVLGLYLLLVPVKCRQKHSPEGNVAVLLTGGYSPDTLESILHNNPDASVFAEHSFWKINPGFRTLHIIGNGIQFPVDDSILPDEVIFHPAMEKRNGFTSIHWNKRLFAGEPLVVQGSYKNLSGKPLRLQLSGFSTVSDSARIENQNNSFTLSVVPRITGTGVYRLFVTDGTDTLENNAIPVEVIVAEKPSLLLLSAYPDFENKFLLGWLSEAEYKVMSRTRISKQKFERNFYNTNARRLDKITADLLDSTDVVIIDEEELKQFDGSEKNLLRDYLSQNKIGLMIRADSTSAGRQLFTGNFVAGISSFSGEKISLHVKGLNEKIILWNSGTMNYLSAGTNAVSLVTDSSGHRFAGLSLFGKGKLVFNAMPPLFPLMISGEKISYGSTWSMLLQKTSPFIEDSLKVFTSTSFPQAQMPVDVVLKTLSKVPPSLYAKEKPLALQQHAWLPGHYNAIYWPEARGWQKVFTAGGKSFPLYLFDSTDWQGIKALETIANTKKIIKQKMKSDTQENVENDFSTSPLSPIYWLVLFIFGSGYLWIERKIP